MSASEVIRLPAGRLLEFAQYGDPAGVPAVFFHGFVGSRHQASFADEACHRHGVRMIAPNRPFVGRSSPADRQFVTDALPDIVALVDALGIKTFAVMGASGGVPYALACLAKLPGRVRVAALASGLGPLADPSVLARMSPAAQRVLLVGRRFPWLIRALLGVRVRKIRTDPEAFLAALIRRWSITDRDLFRRDEVRETMLADVREVFLTGRPDEGLSRELRLYFRWGFRLGDVPAGARVGLWHGRNDVLVPAFMSQHLARHMPGAEATYPAGGHFMVIQHAEAVIRWLASASA